MSQIEHSDEVEELHTPDELEPEERTQDSDELGALDEALVHSGEHVAVTELATQPLPEPDDSLPVGVVVAGQLHLEIVPTLTGSNVTLAPGKLLEAGNITLSTGGPVAGVGLALHKLGITTRLMGKVGNDLFGQAVFQIIAAHGANLAVGMVIAPGEVSSYAIVINPLGSERSIIYASGCNDTLSAADIRYDLVERAQLFHFGYPLAAAPLYDAEGAELVSIFQRVKALGVTTSLDLVLPDLVSTAAQMDWRTLLTTLLPHVDVFLPNAEELLMMLRRPLYEKLVSRARRGNLLDYVEPEVFSELSKVLHDMGASIVAIKAGRRGLYLHTAAHQALEKMGYAQPSHLSTWSNRELWAPRFVVEAATSENGGDATIAGFLMGMLRGMTPQATLAAACAVGASSLEGDSLLSGIRSWPKIMGRIADGWPRLKLQDKKLPALDLTTAGWRWDEKYELWNSPNDQRT